MERKIVPYKKYFEKFFKKLEKDEQMKVLSALDKLKQKQEFTFTHLVKQVKTVKGVYELRTQIGSNELRIFYIYEDETIVVLFNGIKKKDQKLTKKDLEKIKSIKQAYDYGKR